MPASSAKATTRSPVEQCFDYLQSAWQGRDRDALVEPFFALVTDMNEFRLYARRLGRGQFQRFVISGPATATEPALLRIPRPPPFRRFVFWRLFQPDMLLAERGAPLLDRLLRDQVTGKKPSKRLLPRIPRLPPIRLSAPSSRPTPASPARAASSSASPSAFSTAASSSSSARTWAACCAIRPPCCATSSSRKARAASTIPKAPARGMKCAPSSAPCATAETSAPTPSTASTAASSRRTRNSIPSTSPPRSSAPKARPPTCPRHPRTLLYFSAAYNFGLSSAAGERAISLYTLGRIFEQSITELEIMEAEADGRVSINKLSKRKTDGVYYTPEWTVSTIVEQTVGARLEDIKTELGFDTAAAR
jgi:hypothetical protein